MQHLGKLSLHRHSSVAICRHEQVICFCVNNGTVSLTEIDAAVGSFLGVQKFRIRPNTHG